MTGYKRPEIILNTSLIKTYKGRPGVVGAYSIDTVSKVTVDISVGRTKLFRSFDVIGTSIDAAEASARAQMQHWLQGLTGKLTKQRFYVQSVDLKKTGLDPSTAKVTFSAEYAGVDRLVIDVEGANSIEGAEASAWKSLEDFIHFADEKLGST